MYFNLKFCLNYSSFNLQDFPTELQLELMQEDMDAAQADEISPDEQQLEVLEDIWLKAGEIGMCRNIFLICSDYLI